MELIKPNGERHWQCRSAPRTNCTPRLHAYMPSSKENEVALYPNNYQLHTSRADPPSKHSSPPTRRAEERRKSADGRGFELCAVSEQRAKHERTSETCLSGRDVNGVPNKPKKAREEKERKRINTNASLCSFRGEVSAVSRRRSDSLGHLSHFIGPLKLNTK